MPDFMHDQAEGLRQLLDRERLRVITFESGRHGVGKTTVVVNVAAALARMGHRVLMIDENFGPANVGGALGLRPRFELGHVMRQDCSLDEALIEGGAGIALLQAAGGLRALRSMRYLQRDTLVHSFSQLDGRYDFVLIDSAAAPGSPGLFSSAARDTIVVTSTAPAAITDAYWLIKQLHGYQLGRRFYTLLNRASCEINANTVAENLMNAAQGYLATSLQPLGTVPWDETLRRAERGFQSVIDADPAAPSAQGFRRIAGQIAMWPKSSPHQERLDTLMQRMLSGSRFIPSNAGA